MIYIVFSDWYPDNLADFVHWVLPITIILTLIASVVLIASVIKYGGLWGALIRVPLLFTSNICLCTLIGALIVSLGFVITALIALIIGMSGALIILPIILRFMR